MIKHDRHRLKTWIRRQRRIKRRFRDSRLFALFGRYSLHRELWRADRAGLSGGLALGLFIAFTPTIPFQMILAVTGAILLKVNLPIALAACWITNPVTAVPIYLSALRTGRCLVAVVPPLDEFINMFIDGSGPARFIRQNLYLWVGSLAYASIAALGGCALLHLLWNLGSRFAAAVRRLENPRALRDILKGLAPILLLLTGLGLQATGRLDAGFLTRHGAYYARTGWMPPALTLLMAGMYALALPGSMLVLVFGLFHAPPFATLMATVGGTAGSLCGYYLTRNLTAAAASRYADSWLFKRLKQGSGFLVLFALRVLPGFPHAIINYSAGVLRTPVIWFTLSTALGFALKTFIYTSAIHNAATLDKDPVWSLPVLWPLLALALLAAAGWFVEHHLVRRKPDLAPDDD